MGISNQSNHNQKSQEYNATDQTGDKDLIGKLQGNVSVARKKILDPDMASKVKVIPGHDYLLSE